ncbi:MAG: cell division protein ZapA [Firmicutes bacterium]|nr:cell division protein ZapA [Bacillota bacterium]MDH7496085.1 cell division protein ZapA [Bacillota bacterium]
MSDTGRGATGPRKSRVTVKIVDEEYTVRADADAEYVRLLARAVDERVRAALSANPRIARSRAAILACLSFADDLEKLRARYEELMRMVEESR